MDLLLTPTVIAYLVVAGAAAFAVSALFSYVRDRGKLGSILAKTERALGKIREQIAEKQGRIKPLQEEVPMLMPLHRQLQSYYDELMAIHLEAERKAMQEAEKKIANKEREKKRRGWSLE